MRFYIYLIISTLVLSFSVAEARDTIHMWDYEYALKSPEAKAKLGDDITFTFGTKKTANIETDFGEFGSNKKTNAFGKSDEKACIWAFLSAMISLRDRARSSGGNAVVNIQSNYKGHLIDNDKQFECGAGAVLAGVALKGKVVKLKK